MKSGLLTTDEAGEYLGISKGYLYKLMHKKQIAYYQPGGKIAFFNKIDLDKWLKAKKSKGAPVVESAIGGKDQRIKYLEAELHHALQLKDHWYALYCQESGRLYDINKGRK